MYLTLIKSDRIFSLVLPAKKKGRFWVQDLDSSGNCREIVNVEASGSEWICRSTHRATVLDENLQPLRNSTLIPLGLLPIKIDKEDGQAFLFCEPITYNRKSYRKFKVDINQSISIGRMEGNTIWFNNRYVSNQHGSIEYLGKGWRIIDRGSRNGTFVNGLRIENYLASPGDVLFIMGLKIVLGDGFFSLNNPDDKITIDEKMVSKVKVLKHVPADFEDDNYDESKTMEFFYRSPRIRRDVKKEVIKIDLPPSPQNEDRIPMALMLGPSITMGLAAMATALITLTNAMNNGGNITQVMPTLMMSLSMMLGTILWPTMTKRYEKRQRIINEAKRVEKYDKYLEEIRVRIKSEKVLQRDIFAENYVDTETWVKRVLNLERNLWERTNKQPDFLHLRLGIGEMPLLAEIEAPERRFSLEQDELKEKMYSILSEPKIVQEIPVIVSLIESNVVGVIGEKRNLVDFIKTSALQIASLHSYDDVKFVFLMGEENLDDLEYLKFLPHVWNEDRSFRYFASTISEARELSTELEKTIQLRKNDNSETDEGRMPRFIIFGLNRALVDKTEFLKSLLKENGDLGFSLLAFCDSIKNLPKECKVIIEVNDVDSTMYDKEDISGNKLIFKMDRCETDGPLISASLSNIQLDLGSQRFNLPKSLPFLEMFGVGKIEHLNSLTRWKENNPALSLETAIGVGVDGETFMLDLHEKYHGPHGLIAGMTGSGKSEFIITYILSLAVNYHPNEVGFILIDYKGGGLAGAFENKEKGVRLPHLMGTITNLDGSSIKRSLISIQSELRRRQVIFAEARRLTNEGTMDIYKYQRLFRENIVTVPVPHLFIISDEFAELKVQQSEFMEQLISAARIGRSLGIHLILATQKPSGVVDDQIWSNSRFRVCLKVQEKADSMEIIKHPDAAELKNTGRFYLQVGYNEIYELGQSAWTGESYVPAEKPPVVIDNSVRIIDNLGRTIRETALAKKVDNQQNPKQIVSIVRYLSDMAKEENFEYKSLWLDEIPEVITLGYLKKKYGILPTPFEINPLVGECDDPFNQANHPLQINITENGNLTIFGSSGSGKEMLLNTMIYSLIQDHTAKEISLYIIDLGSETLKVFENAQHVGEVLLSEDKEKIESLFKHLTEEIAKRKSLMREVATSFKEFNKINATPLPHILVVISNYAAFNELFSDFEQEVMFLTREGSKFGITFALTANNPTAVKYRLQQNFKQVITLQQNDITDYSMIVGPTDGLYPSKFKGRGLIRQDRVYEFQTACIINEENVMKHIQEFCNQRSEGAENKTTRIRSLPETIESTDLLSQDVPEFQIPVGMVKENVSIRYINLQYSSLYMMFAKDIRKITGFISGFCQVLNQLPEYKVSILDPMNVVEIDYLHQLECVKNKFEEKAIEVYFDVLNRNNIYKDANMKPESLDEFKQKIIVIVGVSTFLNGLTEDTRDKFSTVLNKSNVFQKVRFVLIDHQEGYVEYILQSWYKQVSKTGDKLWIGQGVTNQNVIQSISNKLDLEDEINSNMGYIVENSKASLMKLVQGKRIEE